MGNVLRFPGTRDSVERHNSEGADVWINQRSVNGKAREHPC